MKNYTICEECGEYGKVELNGGSHCENCGCGSYVIEDED